MIRLFLSKNVERLVLFLCGVLISGIASGIIETAIEWSDATLIAVVIVTAIGVVFLAVDSRNSIQSLTDRIGANLSNKAYLEQADMYRDIAKYVENKKVKKAILIQYSSVSATNLLRKLASKGALVNVYVMNPEYAVSRMQAERIRTGIKQLPGVLPVSGSYKLIIHEYEALASIRAVKIDEELIGIGWYTYEHIVKSDKNYPDDRVEISGHDVAGLLLFRGSPEYELFDKMIMNQVVNYKEYIKINSKKPVLKLP